MVGLDKGSTVRLADDAAVDGAAAIEATTSRTRRPLIDLDSSWPIHASYRRPGRNTSAMPSPIRLSAMPVTTMAAPGKAQIHQAVVMKA